MESNETISSVLYVKYIIRYSFDKLDFFSIVILYNHQRTDMYIAISQLSCFARAN
jgi:hypothetical protein